jgi:VanZ family protein
LFQKLYKYIFWTGYTAVLITAFIPVGGDLTRIHLGPKSFQIRLDHLLHIAVYFLICMYFLFGWIKGISLFRSNPITRFIVLTFLLATVTELVQLWVPARAFNLFDWVSNVAGIVLGMTILVFWNRKK